MCLLVLAWAVHPRHRLILAANRDEYHERPTAPLAAWTAPDTAILGGRDLRAGGTWLATDLRGRFGAITNFREPTRPRPEAPSRGGLIPAYLRQEQPPGDYLETLREPAAAYAGFNLLLGDATQLWYASNRTRPFARPLPPGIYGLSNGLLDTSWPKLRRVRQGFEAWLAEGGTDLPALLALLADRTPAKDGELPLTGVSPAWEQTLSPPFVVHPQYGTRCTTVLLQSQAWLRIIERRFDASGEPTGTTDISPGA